MAYQPLSIHLFLLLTTLIISGCVEQKTDTQRISSAKSALQNKNYKESIIHLKNIIETSPDNLEARRLLGQIYHTVGDYDAAEKEINRAIDLGAADSDINLLLAMNLLNKGRYELIGEITELNLTDQDRAKLLAIKAQAQAKLGNRQQAKNAIKESLEVYPESPEIITVDANFTYESDATRAEQALKSVTQSHSDYAPAWSLLGQIHAKNDQLDEAEAHYQQSIALRGQGASNAQFADLLARAIVRVRQGKLAQAQDDIDTARAIAPEYHEIDFLQGVIHFHNNQHDEAQVALQVANGRNHQFLPTIYYLAENSFKLGLYAIAERNILIHLDSAADYRPSRLLLARIQLQRQEYAEAQVLLTGVVEQYPEDVIALALLSDAFKGLKNYPAEKSALEGVIRLAPTSTQAHFKLGQSLLNAGNNYDGIQILTNLLLANPHYWQSAQVLVNHYISQKDESGARAAASAFLKNNPDSSIAHNLLGITHVNFGDLAAAHAQFKQALRLQPEDIVSYQNLAAVASLERDFPKARSHYQQILDRHPEHLDSLIKLSGVHRLEGRFDEQEAYLQQAIEAHPNALQPRLLMSWMHLNKRESDKVLSTLGQMPQDHPNNSEIISVIARSHLLARNQEQAESHLKRLIDLEPDKARGYFLLSQVYAQQNREGDLERQLLKALKLDPDHFLARLALAQLRFRQGNINQASQQLDALEALNSESSDTLTLRAKIAKQQGQDKKARQLFSQVHQQTPNTRTLLAMTEMEWLSGQPTAAIKLLEDWLEENSTDIPAHTFLAKYYLGQQQGAQAIDQYKKVLDLSPNHLAALNNLAWELRKSEPENALQYAQKAESIAPESTAILDTLAVTLHYNQKNELALRTIEKATRDLDIKQGNESLFFHKAQILSALNKIQDSESVLLSLLQTPHQFPERRAAEQLLAHINNSRIQ